MRFDLSTRLLATIFALSSSAFLVSSCQEDDVPAVAVPEGEYVIHVEDIAMEDLTVPKGFSATFVDGALRLSGSGNDANTAGKLAGISIRIPDEVEKDVSGRTVLISIYGKSKEGSGVSAAYWTNEVGNSGWQKLAIGRKESSDAFTYEVPVAKAFLGDSLGIIPDPEKNGQSFDLKTIGVDIID